MDLTSRIVVVTGASRGIGSAVAIEAARAGGKVVLVGRTRGALEEIDDAIGGLQREQAVIAPVDLTHREHVDALGGMLFERFGRIDVLVHAAGEPGILTPVAHMDPTELQKVLAVDIIATQHLIRSFEPLLRASGRGRAMFLTCEIAAAAPAYFGMAAAGKAGLEALVRSWATELRQAPIEVVLVDPGRVAGTRTETRRYPGGSKTSLMTPEQAAAQMLAMLDSALSARDGVVRLQSPSRLS